VQIHGCKFTLAKNHNRNVAMGGGGPPEGASYSNAIGAVYIFNLIVGAGALSLPNAFAQAGFLSGTILLLGKNSRQ
jgi:hypothetical protein